MDTIRNGHSINFAWALIILFSFFGHAHAEKIGFPHKISTLINSANSKTITETGAVILEKRIDVKPQTDGFCTVTVNVTGMLSDQNAVSDYGQISISFNDHYDVVTLDYAKTYAENRHPLVVSNDAVQFKTPNVYKGVKTYSDIKELNFSLPGLAPGVIFEYQVTFKTRPTLSGYWEEHVYFHNIVQSEGTHDIPRIDPVLKSQVLLHLPKQQAFKYALINSELEPAITKDSGGKRLTWTFTDIASVPIEPNMPPLDYILPQLHLTSIDNWSKVGKWASELFMQSCKPNKSIIDRAQRITQGISSTDEKIKAIYNYVQSNIEYVQADFGRGGFRPHSAAQVLQNGYGDCKDKSTLVVSMLKSIGVNANPALLVTAPFRDVDEKLPTVQFNHVIVFIPSIHGGQWIDPTSNSRYPRLYWSNLNRTAFVVNDKEGHLRKTPLMDNINTKGTLSVGYVVEKNQIFLNLAVSAVGALSDNLKNLYGMHPKTKIPAIRSWIKQLYPNSELLSVDFSDLRDSDIDFKLQAKLAFASDDISDNEADRFFVEFDFEKAMSFFSNLSMLPVPDKRKFDIVSNFPFKINALWHFSSPDESFVLGYIPKDKNIDSKFLSFNLKYIKELRAVRVESALSIKTDSINNEEYPDYYKDIQKVIKEGQGGVVFARQKQDKEILALETKIKSSSDDINMQLVLSKEYIKVGRYDDALKLLKKLAVLNIENGEIQYYLGLALGYTGEYDASGQAFEKAKKLGYVP